MLARIISNFTGIYTNFPPLYHGRRGGEYFLTDLVLPFFLSFKVRLNTCSATFEVFFGGGYLEFRRPTVKLFLKIILRLLVN